MNEQQLGILNAIKKGTLYYVPIIFTPNKPAQRGELYHNNKRYLALYTSSKEAHNHFPTSRTLSVGESFIEKYTDETDGIVIDNTIFIEKEIIEGYGFNLTPHKNEIKKEVLNIRTLNEKLIDMQVPTTHYTLMDESIPNENFALIKLNNEWYFFFSGTGVKTGCKKFQDENEACQYMLNHLKRYT